MCLPRYRLRNIIQLVLEILFQACQTEGSALSGLTTSTRSTLGSLSDGNSIWDTTVAFLLLSCFEISFVSLELIKQSTEVPLLQVASLITRIQDACLRVEVHAADGEEN